jgi:hypothetical protein
VAALALPNHSCSVMRDALASKVILPLALVVCGGKQDYQLTSFLQFNAFMTIDSLIRFICCFFFAFRSAAVPHRWTK